MPISRKGVREILGDDDVIAKRPYSATCVCVQNSSSVYAISRKDFLNRLNYNNTWSLLKSKNRDHADWSARRVT
jgi:hypothetical protein